MNGKLISSFALFCFVGIASGAFNIDPAQVTLHTKDGEKTTLVDVVNTGNTPMAIELTVFERKLDIEGELDKKSLKPCNDFTIYPSEIILKKPNEKISVQLTYKVKGNVPADKSYVLFSKEVPISLDEEESDGINMGIQTLTNYYTIINIETGKEGKLTYVSCKAIEDNKIEVIVENRSGGRVATRNLAIQTPSGIIKDFTGTKNSIMPGQQRRFTFKYLRPLTAKEVKFVY